MKVIISHPTGNANVRAAVDGFLRKKMLDRFFTCIASFEGDRLDRLSKLKVFSELRRRKFDKSLEIYTQTFPWYELGRNIAFKTHLNSLLRKDGGLFSIDAVYKSLDKYVSRKLIPSANELKTGVYAYEDSALFSFQKAKRLSIKCFYDLPIGYWRASKHLLLHEIERWPAWQSTITGFDDSEEKCQAKDEELRLADHIFVASRFTAETLNQYPGILPPVSVIPYGFPKPCFQRSYESYRQNRKLKMLYVGSLSQRKGLADLFAAVKILQGNIELTVVGRKVTDNCTALNNALGNCKWISSLSHNEILAIMQQHDVLVFPSLFEGFGLVITEAMSQGTPVITTDRTAGPDLITHGEDGWLIKAGSTEALVQAIDKLLLNPALLKKAGLLALETASQRPWKTYGNELAKAVQASYCN